MAGILVDSDILIDVLRGAPGAAESLARLAASTGLATSTVTVFEVLRGATTAGSRNEFVNLIADFDLFSLDGPAATMAADIWIETRRAGTPIDTGDLLIAGIALSQGLALATRNQRDFQRIRGLRLEFVG